jgi:hypothetical protein
MAYFVWAPAGKNHCFFHEMSCVLETRTIPRGNRQTRGQMPRILKSCTRPCGFSLAWLKRGLKSWNLGWELYINLTQLSPLSGAAILYRPARLHRMDSVPTTEYISLQEMKQGQCICPLSWSVHCNFTGDGKCNKRGWACTPHPHQPSLILPL